MRKLVEAFNPQAVEGLMCRTLISVDWTGRIYDCDFNQMLDLPLLAEAPSLPNLSPNSQSLPQTLSNLDPQSLSGRRIATGPHCFGCTAGSGSSCGGAVLKT
jgi:hypothetical protein